MKLWFINFLVFASLSARAQQPLCPRLEGNFHCRATQPFDINVKNTVVDGVWVYSFTDPTGLRNIGSDGQTHEMDFSNGKGQYSARCNGYDLLIEGTSPEGEKFSDRYYIERAALVRVRLSEKRQPSSLSCAPVRGTWRIYGR